MSKTEAATSPKSPTTPLSKVQRKSSRDQSLTHRKTLSRESSHLSDADGHRLVSREASFVYDTTVEAFKTQGVYIDDEDLDIGGEDDTDIENQNLEGISIIGKLVLSPNQEKGILNINEEVLISSSPAKVENLFLTDYDAAQTSYYQSGSEGVDIPSEDRQQFKEHKLATVSTKSGAENRISTTPQAEKYFLKREKSFMEKVARGQLESLAVDISDFNTMERSVSGSELSVKPLSIINPETEVEIHHLDAQHHRDSGSHLTVKPAEDIDVSKSSYEAIYGACIDFADIEEDTDHRQAVPQLLQHIGDESRHDLISKVIPEHVSSADGLESMMGVGHYEVEQEGMTSRHVTMRTTTNRHSQQFTEQQPGPVRWSAPPGSLEPPSICPPEEFIIHLGNIADQQQGTDQHWHQLRILPEELTHTNISEDMNTPDEDV